MCLKYGPPAKIGILPLAATNSLAWRFNSSYLLIDASSFRSAVCNADNLSLSISAVEERIALTCASTRGHARLPHSAMEGPNAKPNRPNTPAKSHGTALATSPASSRANHLSHPHVRVDAIAGQEQPDATADRQEEKGGKDALEPIPEHRAILNGRRDIVSAPRSN